MKVLVVGGSGFVGYAVVRSLLSSGHSVTVMNRGNKSLRDVEQLIADRNNEAEVNDALSDRRFDAVIDTNCYSGDQAQIMIDALGHRTPCAVMISSAAVYSDQASSPPTESEPLGGGSAWGDYGSDKFAAEQAYADAGFARAVAFRPPYIYGPNNDLDRETWFFRRILAKRPILVPGLGTARYQFLHEDDLGSAINLWLQHNASGFQAYNLASPQLVTATELPKMFARAANCECTVICVGEASGTAKARDWYPFRDVDCTANSAAFVEEYDWHPSVSLETGFANVFLELSSDLEIGSDDWSTLEESILSKVTARQE